MPLLPRVQDRARGNQVVRKVRRQFRYGVAARVPRLYVLILFYKGRVPRRAIRRRVRVYPVWGFQPFGVDLRRVNQVRPSVCHVHTRYSH